MPFKNHSATTLKEDLNTDSEKKFSYCNKCSNMFTTTLRLRTHKKSCQDICSDRRKEPLVCGFPGCTFSCRSKKAYTNLKVLNKHKLVVHKGERAFTCDKCDHSFAKNLSLLQHKLRVHRGLAFKCLGEVGVSVEKITLSSTLRSVAPLSSSPGNSCLPHRNGSE